MNKTALTCEIARFVLCGALVAYLYREHDDAPAGELQQLVPLSQGVDSALLQADEARESMEGVAAKIDALSKQLGEVDERTREALELAIQNNRGILSNAEAITKSRVNKTNPADE